MVEVLHSRSSKHDQNPIKFFFFKKEFDKFLKNESASENLAHLSLRLVLEAKIHCGPIGT